MNMDLCDLSPSYVRSIAPYQPGKPISELAREMGLDEASIVKLASNENPRGIGPRGFSLDASLTMPASSMPISRASSEIGLPGWYGAIVRTYEGDSSQRSISIGS